MKNPRVSVYIGLSQDGFIARPNGDIDWLTDNRYTIEGEDFGYQAFMDTVDVLVMGRITFEKVLTFGEWPYQNKSVLVLTQRKLELPESIRDRVNVLSLPPAVLVEHAVEQGWQHIYIDGGQTIQRFLLAGLVNDLTLTRLPVLIGQGIPLFGPLTADVQLQHVETKTFPNGFVQSRYTVGTN